MGWEGVSSLEMESVTWIQILNKAVWIALHANALDKGMNLSLLTQLWVNS